MSDPTNVRVAVLGASGFAGGELIRLLQDHPAVELTFLGAHGSVGKTLGEVHPNLAQLDGGDEVLRELVVADIVEAADVAFCSLPHGASAELAPPLLEAGLRVIDLAGDFRLPASAYPDWYGFEHPSADWLGKAVYGLPELFGDQLPGAQLVANPGCFPTPVILGLAPLLSAGLVDAGPDPRGRQDRAVGRRPRRERGGVVRLVRGERASVSRAATSAHARRWSAAWSWRRGSRPA